LVFGFFLLTLIRGEKGLRFFTKGFGFIKFRADFISPRIKSAANFFVNAEIGEGQKEKNDG